MWVMIQHLQRTKLICSPRFAATNTASIATKRVARKSSGLKLEIELEFKSS